MIILGLDPGTSKIGYGIIEVNRNTYSLKTLGTIVTAPGIENKDRVLSVFGEVEKLIKKWRPVRISIEKLFFFKNAKTALSVSEMRGILLLCASKNKITIDEFTPLQIKQAVSSYGRADKRQVQHMIQLILNMKEPPRPDDAADALAAALCSANNSKFV